jgi:hypothetical protein
MQAKALEKQDYRVMRVKPDGKSEIADFGLTEELARELANMLNNRKNDVRYVAEPDIPTNQP